MMNKTDLNDEMLVQVSGGTFDNNRYTTNTYRSVGIEVVDHWFEKDEFILENGDHISYEEANELVRAHYGDEESARMAHLHRHSHYER